VQTYTVRSGDLIDGIARRFGITRQALLDLNPSLSNPYAIHVGQILRVRPEHEASAIQEFALGVDACGQPTRRSEYRLTSRREAPGCYLATFPVEVGTWTWQATVVGGP
jgi:LysM repeat protein